MEDEHVVVVASGSSIVGGGLGGWDFVWGGDNRRALRHIIELNFWGNVVHDVGCRTCWVKRAFVW